VKNPSPQIRILVYSTCYCYLLFIFSEFNSISKAEISELIETKTKMMGTEIELIKSKTELLEAKTKLLEAKSLSEAEIIKLIKSNSIGSGKLIDCPVHNPLFQIVGGTCFR
jgi:hypothetical protein